jgi:bifunctional non-homologous end joining protein LigD
VFDFDPDPKIPFTRVVEAARGMKQLLESIKLNAFVKTTGGKGLHVVVPVAPTVEWDEAKGFCKSLAEEMARREPKKYTTNMRKVERHGRIFVDYLRNGRTATAVLPYSVRWRAGASVALPLEWSELGRLKAANQFTIKDVPKRISRQKRDPWADFDSARVDLRRAL